MKKKNSGFTLVELILVTGLISVATIGIYVTFNNKYNSYMTSKQADYLERITTDMNSYLMTVSNNPAQSGVASAAIAANVTPTNLITARIIPPEMVRNGTTIRNVFDGNFTVAPVVLDVTPNDGIGNAIANYEITLNNIPPYACSGLVTDSRLANMQRLIINGNTIKNAGFPISSADIGNLANSCNNANNTMQIMFTPYKF